MLIEYLWPYWYLFGKTRLNGNRVEPVFVHNAFWNNGVHFHAFPMHFKALAVLSNRTWKHWKPFENHLGNIFQMFACFSCMFQFTSFLCIVCHVFTWEVTFWNIKFKASYRWWILLLLNHGMMVNLACCLHWSTTHLFKASLNPEVIFIAKDHSPLKNSNICTELLWGYVRGHISHYYW